MLQRIYSPFYVAPLENIEYTCGKEFTDIKHPNKKFCSRQCIIRNLDWCQRISKSQKREKGPNWKGGSYISDKVYKLIYDPSVPKRYSMEHRLIMEKHIGRKLTKKEVVHHINKNKLDNRIENLSLLPNKKAHMDEHKIWNNITETIRHRKQPHSPETKERIRLAWINWRIKNNRPPKN